MQYRYPDPQGPFDAYGAPVEGYMNPLAMAPPPPPLQTMYDQRGGESGPLFAGEMDPNSPAFHMKADPIKTHFQSPGTFIL